MTRLSAPETWHMLPCTACGKQRKSDMLVCRDCWLSLPDALRDGLQAANTLARRRRAARAIFRHLKTATDRFEMRPAMAKAILLLADGYCLAWDDVSHGRLESDHADGDGVTCKYTTCCGLVQRGLVTRGRRLAPANLARPWYAWHLSDRGRGEIPCAQAICEREA